MKILNKEQINIKIEKDKRRKKFREELKRKGYKIPKIKNGYNNYGQTSQIEFINTSNSSEITSNTSDSGEFITSSGFTTEKIAQAAAYLNPTISGFDVYWNYSQFGIYHDDATGYDIEFDQIQYVEFRMATGTVDVGNYASKWSSATVIALYGDFDTYGGDVTQNPFEEQISGLSNNDYTLMYRYKYRSSAYPTWQTNAYGWKNSSTTLNILTAPSGIYTQADNDFEFTSYATSSARVFEFNRSAYTPYSSYRSSEAHNILYNCALRNHEFDIYYGQANPSGNFDILTMWDTGTYEVKLSFDASHPSATQTRFSNAVNAMISLVNSTISGSGVSFTRNDSASSPDILIVTQSNSALGGAGGIWSTSVNGNGNIYYAYIRWNYETDTYEGIWNTVEDIICEEFYQSLGIGGDLRTRTDIINTDFNYRQKHDTTVNFATEDTLALQLLYTEDLDQYVGLGPDIVALALNPYNGYMTTTGTAVNMLNFAENTTYNYRIWQAKTDDSYSVVPAYSSTFTTGEYPDVPSAPIAGTPPRVDAGLNLTWSATTGCDKYDLQYRNYAGSQFESNIVGTSHQLTGLEYGVTYYLSLRGVSNGYEPKSDWSSENSLTTAPKMPSCSKSSDTGSITLNFSGFSGNWTQLVIQYSEDYSYSSSMTINYPSTNTTINSLNSDTQYNFKVSIYYTVGVTDIYAVDSSGDTDYLYFSKSTTRPRPSNWSWINPIVQGGNIYSVVGKKLYIMPATEWNSFTSRINEFRYYKGFSNYSFTTVSTDSDFTATIFNQARLAIGAMLPPTTVPPTVDTGDDITAAGLNGLRDSLNSIV